MRFADLPRGSAFQYQGREYVKTSPLAATPRDGGTARLFARSAPVALLDGNDARRGPVAVGPELSRAAVQAALDQLHAQAQQSLEAAGAAATERASLSALRDRLLRQLGLLP